MGGPILIYTIPMAVGATVSIGFYRWLRSRSPMSDLSFRMPFGLGNRWVSALAVGLLGWAVASPAAAVVGPMLVLIARAELDRRRRWRKQYELARQLPGLVDVMIQRLRSGASLHSVCLDLPHVGEASSQILAPISDALARRHRLSDAVAMVADRDDLPPPVELLTTTLAVLAERGGPSVAALLRLRLALMALVHANAEAQAKSGQALASAAMLTTAPALFVVVVAAADHDAANLYLREPVGAVCLGSSVLLAYLGWRWMLRSVASLAEPNRERRQGRRSNGRPWSLRR